MIYHKAKHLDDALNLIHEYPDTILLSGSTDIAVQLNKQSAEKTLIDISDLSELQSIKTDSNSIHIGALVTITEILDSVPVQTHLPLLESAAKVFGSYQIRNLATLGGNIANASPAADLTAVLLVLKAKLILGSKKGKREIALEDLFCGYKCTKLDHEMILGIMIPLQEHQWYYRKVGPRERLNITKASLAVIKNREGYCISGASLNAYPLRFKHMEAVLNKGDLRDKHIKDALENDIHPSGSLRSTKAYRIKVTFNMIKEALKGFAS